MDNNRPLTIADVDRLFDGWMSRTQRHDPGMAPMVESDVEALVSKSRVETIREIKLLVFQGAAAIALAVGGAAFTVVMEVRDAVSSSRVSDERLDARYLWMKEKDAKDAEQDRALQRVDPSYKPRDIEGISHEAS